MERSEGSHLLLVALVLPPIVLSLLLLLLALAGGTSSQVPPLVTLVVLTPLGIFVELAALVVAFSRWRSGKLRGVVGLASAAIGLVTLLGATLLIDLSFSGGGV